VEATLEISELYMMGYLKEKKFMQKVRRSFVRRFLMSSILLAMAGAFWVLPSGWKPNFHLGSTSQALPVKEYTLISREVEWEVAPGYTYKALTFNGSIPGPTIEATEGEIIRVKFKNELPEPHSIHAHGVQYEFQHDGTYPHTPSGAVPPGGEFVYEWKAVPGTWFYHDHSEKGVEATRKGMYGAIIVHPKNEQVKPDRDFILFYADLEPEITGFTDHPFSAFNGKAGMGNTPVLKSQVGDLVRFRLINLMDEPHTFHIHGHRWEYNGKLVDTVSVLPGETATFEFKEDAPGQWAYHCHFLTHMEEGMMGMYEVSPK
jgi:FtsP/CotA-like multicopper oxidase with cupredoxin domain